MKMNDCVRLIRDRKQYDNDGVHVGDEGILLLNDVRNGYVLVGFDGGTQIVDGYEIGIEKEVAVLAEDLEMVWSADGESTK